MEDNVMEKQPNLGPYCLQYKLHNKINSKLHEEKRLNDGSLEKKVIRTAKTVILILTVHTCTWSV